MGDLRLESLTSLSKTSDHVGALANVLKDLGGPTTLLHELTQNADDAKTAAAVRFTLNEQSMTVWNDGEFTSCGAQDRATCPWGREGRRSCDLHSFRTFAGRHKAGDAETTGAFGVGFTCVYHVTDHPELITGGYHLILDELAAEGDRIQICADSCTGDHESSGTTFILPWAREQTELRSRLGVQPVTDKDLERLDQSLHAHAVDALLFLQRISRLEVRTPSATRTISRFRDGNRVRVSDGKTTQDWLLLENSFDSSHALKRKYVSQIDPGRSDLVQVALRVDQSTGGRVYAGLPTETRTGWGGHVNGSFYPRQDRKGVQFDDGTFRSEWNRDVIDSAAVIIANSLEQICETLGFDLLWRLLRDFERIDRDVDSGRYDASFRAFLRRAMEVAKDTSIMLTTDGRTREPAGCVVPQTAEEYVAAEILAALGLDVVHESLRSIVMETSYTDYGIKQLTAAHIIDALLGSGPTQPWRRDDNGPFEPDQVEGLLTTLEFGLARSPSTLRQPEIRQVAIVPCLGGSFAPAATAVLARNDDETALFQLLAPELHIADVDALHRLCPSITTACVELTVGFALDLLEGAEDENLQAVADLLLDWFDDHRSDIHDNQIKAQLASLPIFPSASGEFRPLTALSLQSDFTDHLGVAKLVDQERTRGHTDLLRLLGAEELGAVEYLVRHVASRANEGNLTRGDLLHVLEIVSQSRAQLEADQEAFETIAETCLVPCHDEVVRPALEVQMPTEAISLISPEAPIADLTGMQPHLRDALVWLGVSRSPSHEILNQAAYRLASSEGDPGVAVVTAILDEIRDAFEQYATVPLTLAHLRDQPWLPVEGGGRAKPSDVYPTFARHLFESQGPKLGLPRPTQEHQSQTLYWLGMPTGPTTALIVAHLRHCSRHDVEMNNAVYTALGDAEEESLVATLSDEACIQVAAGVFVLPSNAYWAAQGFGRWAHRLLHEHRRYQKFFDRVGVKEEPGPTELEAVLRRMSQEIGNNRLDDEALAVAHECWTRLSDLLVDHPGDTHRALDQLSRVRSAVDARGMFAPPETLLFRDGRGLSDRMQLLAHNVVRRERTTWRALAAAGVEAADDHIAIELHEVKTEPAHDLTALLSDRRDAIVRLLEGTTDDEDEPTSVDSLFALELFVTPALNVRFRASIGNQVEITQPERLDAVYLAGDGEPRLVYDTAAPTRAIARELARCLQPNGDLSRIAPLLDAVLGEPSLAEAHGALDDYGVADLTVLAHEPVDTQVAEDVTTQGVPVDDAGMPATEGTPDAVLEQAPAAEDSMDEFRQSGDDETDPSAAAASDHEGGGANGDQASGRPEPNSSDARRPESGSGGPGRDRQRSSPRASGAQSRLRSYVVYGDDGSTGMVGDEAPDYSSLDAAGIRRVLAFEESCGRVPEEQEHHNPGFDILSRNKDHKVLRRIEVKSIGGDWTIRGVMMSRRQFDEASANTDDFWLYVVENAEDDDSFRIFRIHNPSQRIAHFGFDDGWKVATEPDVERNDSGTPTARSTRARLSWGPSTT